MEPQSGRQRESSRLVKRTEARSSAEPHRDSSVESDIFARFDLNGVPEANIHHDGIQGHDYALAKG